MTDIEILYKFTEKKTGKSWGYSRHEFPDFVADIIHQREKELGKRLRLGPGSSGYEEAKKARDKYFEVTEIIDKKEIYENTFHVREKK